MANQQTQPRVRRIASPSLKGPMRATFPFGLRQGSSPTTVSSRSARKGSPSSSPTPSSWSQTPSETLRKNPRSPDHRASPDRAGSPFINIKDKQRARHSPVALIKRTTSLDTITTPYLKGEWPRETVVPYHTLVVSDTPVNLTAEQATQTPEEWEELYERKKKGSHIRSTSLGNGENLIKKETIKARLAKSKEVARSSTCSIQRTSPVPANHAAIVMATLSTTTLSPTIQLHSKAVNIPHIPTKPNLHIRGSVEGLSQEIERLVLNKDCSGRTQEEFTTRTQESAPDGHRAPVAEMLGTTRTVDTQTPAVEEILLPLGVHEELDESRSSSSSHSHSSPSSLSPPDSRSQSESPPSLPIIPGTLDTSRPSSLCDNTDSTKQEKGECESHKFQSIFIREPPDGCERIKIVQDESGPEVLSMKHNGTPPLKESLFCPIKNPSERYCIPSTTSAFCPLLKPYVRQASDMALRTSPSAAVHTIEGQ